MKPPHILLALMVAAIWGFNFVVIRYGLNEFPPLLLAALRFIVAALPVLVLPRPAIPWPKMVALGFALFVFQFAFLFTGMSATPLGGMTAGLSSVVIQTQAFFTILLATAVLRERPKPRQIAGVLVAACGLALIASTVGGEITPIGLCFVLASGASWAVGNVLLRGLPKVEMLHLMVWLCLVPPLPLLAGSLVFEGGPNVIWAALAHADWIGVGTVLYLAIPVTLLGFGIWGWLLARYPAATVAPFSLLVPIFGAASSALVLGERFGMARLSGMVLIMAGLAVIVLPLPAFLRRRATS